MVIMGMNWSRGPPPTKTVCLAGLEVPRVGRRDNPDEPFAFASREFLRKKCIGKTVRFRIDFVVVRDCPGAVLLQPASSIVRLPCPRGDRRSRSKLAPLGFSRGATSTSTAASTPSAAACLTLLLRIAARRNPRARGRIPRL